MGSTKQRLKIIQWNARSAFSNHNLLKSLIKDSNLDIGIISETWYKPNYNIFFKGYNIIRNDRPGGKGGVAILIKKGLSFKTLNIRLDNTRLEVCGVNIMVDKITLSVVSVYRPPNAHVDSRTYEKIFTSVCRHCIVAGDFNAHHTLWGCVGNDRHGISLIDALNNHPTLVVRNEGQSTRLNAPGTNPSALDISIISSNLVNNSTWEVLGDTYGSDHFPIGLIVGENPVRTSVCDGVGWNTNNADWCRFSAEIHLKSNNFNTDSHNANDIIQFVCNNICTTADSNFKQKQKSQYKTSPPWWDNECSELAKVRKIAFREFKEHSSLEKFLNCKKITAKCKLLYKKKSKDSWHNFCGNLNGQSSPSNIWKRINAARRGLTESVTNTMTTEDAESFIKNIAPDTVPLKIPQYHLNNTHFLSLPISIEEFNANIKKQKDTSPGLDGVSYSMLNHLPDSCKGMLCIAFDKVISRGDDIPIIKKSLIVPISKPGKPGEFRPISLSSCILKTLERIIKSRLEWWCESRDFFSPFQFGFRRGVGTTDCLAHLVTDIQNTFSDNEFLGALFLDISSAYENVNLHILIDKLSLLIPRGLACNIVRLFAERNISIKTASGIGDSRTVSAGLPQGFVLSPFLFNVYTRDIFDLGFNATILQYADDFCIYTRCKEFQQCKINLNHIMYICNLYFPENGFTLSDDKSAVMLFTRHRVDKENTMLLNNTLVPWVQSFKYLGVILDQKLNWNNHINYVINKSEKSLNLLRAVASRSWGSDPKTMLLFYKSFTRSILDIGCLFYGAACRTSLRKIDVCQFKALRLATGAFRSTPVQALLVECQEPPLYLRRQMLAEKFVIKTLQYNNNRVVRKIASLATSNLVASFWIHKNNPPLAEAFTTVACFENTLNKIDRYPIYSHPYNIYFLKFKVIFPKFTQYPTVNRVILENELREYYHFYKIYTDGSKNHDGAGFAYAIPELDITRGFKCGAHSSIFTAEALAILKVLEYVVSEPLLANVVILSDSQSVLKSLNNPSLRRNLIITRILSQVSILSAQNRRVDFIWIKGHSGLHGNELADAAARNAIEEGQLVNGIARSDLYAVVKKSCFSKWDNNFKEYAANTCNHYSSIYPSCSKHPAVFRLQLPRRLVVSYLRFLFGHGSFNKHLYKLKLSETPHCHCDNQSIDDLNHRLFNCSLNTQANSFLLNELNKMHILPLNSSSFMTLVSTTPKIENIFIKFLKMSVSII